MKNANNKLNAILTILYGSWHRHLHSSDFYGPKMCGGNYNEKPGRQPTVQNDRIIRHQSGHAQWKRNIYPGSF